MSRFNRMMSTLAFTVLLVGHAVGATAVEDSYDWDVWRRIVVQQGGRMKPLDTLAWEFVMSVTNERSTYRPAQFRTIASVDVVDWVDFTNALKNADGNKARKRVWDRLPAGLRREITELDFSIGEAKEKLKDVVNQLEGKKSEYSKSVQIVTYKELAYEAVGDQDVEKLLAEYDELRQRIEQVDRCESELIIQLNKILTDKTLYDATAWGDLPEKAAESAKKSNLDKAEQQQLNDALVRAAFPESLKEFQPTLPAEATITVEGRKYNAVELYVTWLLTWQGWDKVTHFKQFGGGRDDEVYWRFHQPDEWDVAPMINARYEGLKPKLKPETETGVSTRTLLGNDEFEEWVMAIHQKSRAEQEELDPAEKKALNVFEAYLNFAQLRLGYNLQVLRSPDSSSQDWLPLVAVLVDNDRTADAYDAAAVAQIRKGFHQARKGLLSQNPAEFNEGSELFADGLEQISKQSDLYLTADQIDTEIHYNSFAPFKVTTILSALAMVVLALSLGIRTPALHWGGFGILLAALSVMSYGMFLRYDISGRGPVTNMYETLIWSSLVSGLIAVTLGAIYRQQVITFAAATVVTAGTLLANILPPEMGSTITPLMPVLRSNYWLVVHVMTIVASYGAFMLAWCLGNIGVGKAAYGGMSKEIKDMATFAYRSIQVGVLLLAAGTILGGWWAAESWGRFWGWDPKEVWALIALLLYLAMLHARYVGWVKNFGLLAWSVVCFSGVVMAWYGVNFVLGAGLHAYAFGTGGLWYVIGGVAANFAYVIGAAVVFNNRRHQAQTAPAPMAVPEDGLSAQQDQTDDVVELHEV